MRGVLSTSFFFPPLQVFFLSQSKLDITTYWAPDHVNSARKRKKWVNKTTTDTSIRGRVLSEIGGIRKSYELCPLLGNSAIGSPAPWALAITVAHSPWYRHRIWSQEITTLPKLPFLSPRGYQSIHSLSLPNTARSGRFGFCTHSHPDRHTQSKMNKTCQKTPFDNFGWDFCFRNSGLCLWHVSLRCTFSQGNLGVSVVAGWTGFYCPHKRAA